MNAPDQVTVHHLVTTTIPLTLTHDAQGGAITLQLDVDEATTTVRRLTEFDASLLDDEPASTSGTYVGWADAILGTPDKASDTHAVDDPYEYTPEPRAPKPDVSEQAAPEQAAAVVSTNTPEPVAPKPAARRGSPESAAINDNIRTWLTEGDSIKTIAQRLKITDTGVRQRIKRYNLGAPAKAPKPAPKKTLLPNAAPTTAASTPTPAPSTARSRTVPALGAKRRIQSLYAIGYDAQRLNQRLSNTDIVVSTVLDDDVTEIDRRTHDTIHELWLKLRYNAVTPSPASRTPRHYPAPGLWDNIDDPNETHERGAA